MNTITCGRHTMHVGVGASEFLPQITENSVHCAITSPPYWGLRDYGIPRELGSEATIKEYTRNLVDICREVKRVLRPDGIFWLNLGDCYGRGFGGGTPGGKQETNKGSYLNRKPSKQVGNKQLVGVPWRVAFALQKDGWFLRSAAVWAKRNGMPESTHDRPTKSYEFVFMLTKSPKYFYDWAAVLTEPAPSSETRFKYAFGGAKNEKLIETDQNRTAVVGNREFHGGSRLRDVWWFSVGGFKGAHFAVYPVSIPLTCIRAGTADKVCSTCGTPYEHFVGTTREATRPAKESKIIGHSRREVGKRDPGRHVTTVQTGGWKRNCECPGTKWKRATVLDPFAGASTTALAAEMLDRRSIGIELNPKYGKFLEQRIAEYKNGRRN